MLDHVGLPASDFGRGKRFYEGALSPLGHGLLMEPGPYAAGFGRPGKPDFWIFSGSPGQAIHVAFAAENRATVDAFHRVATAAGGQDNGAPGLRPEYHPGYYAAFVLDHDGNNIEAACHPAAGDA